MKIESLIKRAKGTQIRLGKTDYDFQPEKDGGPHVCEVKDEQHIALLLSIKEGYRQAGAAAPEPEAPVAAPDEFPLAGIDVANLSNKDLMALAGKHLGLTGTNRAKAIEFGKKNFDIDLSAGKEKATYNEILREIMTRCVAAETQAKLEAAQDGLEKDGE